MKLREQQNLFVADVCRLVQYAYLKGFEVTFGEAYRTKEQQDIYVKEGKSKTYNSRHLQRLAIDLNFFIDGEYITSKEALQELGIYWEGLNPSNRWGGNYKTFIDTPHFERLPK